RPPPLTPPHKGEGNAPSARHHPRSSTNEHAPLRRVRCFTLRTADALYGGDVTERSVMVVGLLPPPLLGVSSLDWAPLAAASGAFFVVTPIPTDRLICCRPRESGDP